MNLKLIWHWLSRIRVEVFMLLLSGAGLLYFGISLGNFEMIMYKIFLLSTAVILVHFSRQFLFPDFGLWRLLTNSQSLEPEVRAAAILGIFIFMGLVISAFMTGA